MSTAYGARFLDAKALASCGRIDFEMDHATALRSILTTCLRLRPGSEARLDRNVLRHAFPLGLDPRPYAVQLAQRLVAANDGIFGCTELPGGDSAVRKIVRRELVQPPRTEAKDPLEARARAVA
jgi:hypothetical protein